MGRRASVIFDNDTCLICGNPYVHIHHIFYGTANRRISDKYGYTVALCQAHHTGNDGVHFNKSLDLELKQKAQKHFEENIGTRDEFIKTFGKSYA